MVEDFRWRKEGANVWNILDMMRLGNAKYDVSCYGI